jgi:heat shock protein HslJ
MHRFHAIACVTLLALGCSRPEEAAMTDSTPAVPPPTATVSASPPVITDRDWALASLGERTNPMGAGNRAPTLRLDAAAGRASGFAGCNRFTGPFTLAGDSLRFGPLVSTKMACADGNEVETAYLAALGQAQTWTATDSTLTLHLGGAAIAGFRAQ